MSSVVAQHSALWDRGAFQEQQGAVARAKLVTGSSRQAGSTANMEQARLWQPSCVYRALQVGQQPHSLGAQQASNRVPIPGALRFATYPALPAAVCCTAQASCYCVQLATCPVNLVVLLPHLLHLPQAFLDTLLVLAIVIGSGSLLFGVNVVLANASEWWYHQ